MRPSENAERLNRRKFMRLATLGTAGALAAVQTGCRRGIGFLENERPLTPPIISEEAERLARELERTYKIQIRWDGVRQVDDELGSTKDTGVVNAFYANADQVEDAILKLADVFEKYPPFIFERQEKELTVFLVAGLKNSKNKRIRGAHRGGDLYFDLDDNAVVQSGHHEIYHWLDKTDGRKKDDALWESFGPMKEDKASEDQAELAQELLESPESLRKILEKCRKDPVLHRRVELMTGAVIDTDTNRFKHMLSREAFARTFGTQNRQYYPKWTSNKMNFRTWNKLLDGEKTKWTANRY